MRSSPTWPWALAAAAAALTAVATPPTPVRAHDPDAEPKQPVTPALRPA